MQLRPYQQRVHDEIDNAWKRVTNVLAVMPTGAGKTVTFAKVVAEESHASVVLAHRAELVSQMSVALARERVRHRIVGPPALARLCSTAHILELNNSYIDSNAKAAAASVQSIASYKNSEWFPQVKLWVHDEAHHLLAINQFGKAVAKFPHARGLGVTATPGRTDGKGLGRHADGLMDVMILGPQPRELMDAGYLCQYKIFAPPSTLDRSKVHVTASGELSAPELKAETKLSSVLGDIVEHYCRYARGKQGLTFSDSIENAIDIAQRFKAQGVAAEVLSGKTPDPLRAYVLQQYAAKQVQEIVSVQLIDEGFDCPGVEVVSDGGATESLQRFLQRFGRGWRPLEGKPYMMYFDHVGNTIRHGLPDAPRAWTLDRRDRRASALSDAIPLRVCLNPECVRPYERVFKCCPFCGFYPIPAVRTAAEFVDGDLQELDAATLAALRGEQDRVDGPARVPQHLDPIAQAGVRNKHWERQQGQRDLRNAIDWWRGLQAAQGRGDSESYRRFYHQFGTDIASVLVLGAREAGELAGRISADLARYSIDSSVDAALYGV